MAPFIAILVRKVNDDDDDDDDDDHWMEWGLHLNCHTSPCESSVSFSHIMAWLWSSA